MPVLYRVRALLLAVAGLGLAFMSSAGVPVGRALAQQPTSTFRGSSPNTPYGPLSLHAGIVVLHAKSNNTSNFGVTLILPDPAASVVNDDNSLYSYLLVNAVQPFTGDAVVLIPADGNYYVWVGFASGAYEITVNQPAPETATPVNQTSFSGSGQQATPTFQLSAGTYTVTTTADDQFLRVWLYHLDSLGGGVVTSPLTGYYDGRLIDYTFPPAYKTLQVDVPEDGLYFFYADANSLAATKWTVSIQ